MGLGVIEPKHGHHVPGTIVLDQTTNQSDPVTNGLKRGTGRNSHLVLAPQPSEDPNDPLNWSVMQRHTVMFIVCFGTLAVTVAPVSDC